MKQVDFVIKAVTSYCADKGIAFELNGPKVEFTDSQRNDITELLFASYQSGDLEIKSEKSQTNAKTYLKSMLGNHLRKDKRLNGDVNYADIKKEGKKRITDEKLRELQKLFKMVSAGGDAEVIKQVKAELDARQAIVDAAKAKKEEIKAEHIPESLRHLIPATPSAE
jgi:hypothetical protein